jgi:uncharacterized protein (TIGR03083 family)
VAGPSYASEWSIAQTVSHLGSGAEIFSLFLEAGAAGGPSPDMSGFGAIWARWDGKSPEDQARDGVAADAAFLAAVDALDAATRDAWRLDFFGAVQDLGALLRMRLGEHVLHTWDVAVMADPGATLLPAARALAADGIDVLTGMVGQPSATALSVRVQTEDPDLGFDLEAGPDGVTLRPTGDRGATGGPTLTLPAEALLRLVSGRLDPAHTPALTCDQVDLDDLRRIFPGF